MGERGNRMGIASHCADRPLVRFARLRSESTVLLKTFVIISPLPVDRTKRVARHPTATIPSMAFRLIRLKANTIVRHTVVVIQLPREPDKTSHSAATRHTRMRPNLF